MRPILAKCWTPKLVAVEAKLNVSSKVKLTTSTERRSCHSIKNRAVVPTPTQGRVMALTCLVLTRRASNFSAYCMIFVAISFPLATATLPIYSGPIAMDAETEDTSILLNQGCNNVKLFMRDFLFLRVVKGQGKQVQT